MEVRDSTYQQPARSSRHTRLFQWIGIFLVLIVGVGIYWQRQGEAGVTTSAPEVTNEVATSGLVGHWTFDAQDISGTTVTDRGTGGNNGTITGTTKTVGKLGQALSFGGDGNYVRASDSSAYSGLSAITVSGWFNATSKPGASGHYWFLVGKANWASQREWRLRFEYELGQILRWSISNDGNSPDDANSVTYPLAKIELNTWYHIVGTYDDADSDVLKLYVNGVLVGTATGEAGPIYDGTANLAVGTSGDNGSSSDPSYDDFLGKADDVRVYNRALSASEVYQLYTAGTATVNAPVEDPLSQGLRGYWKLDDGTGTNATDGSGNGNTLAMTGSPSWVTGNIGPSALDFSGSGQYLSVADPASGVLDFAQGADFSITGWFNRDTFAADHTIVAKKTNQTTDAGYVVWIDEFTDDVNFEISDGTDTYAEDSIASFTATGWHHFAAVWNDSNGAFIYIDGVFDDDTTTSTASIDSLSNANAFTIGAESDAGVPFDGRLDDIRVYGYALSADEVAKLYNTTAPAQPVDTSLVGHWTFDGPDIQGTTAIDRSGKGNNGTITGAVPIKGKLGQGLSFDGVNDYIDAGDLSNTIDNTSMLSVALWVRQDTLIYAIPIAKYNSGGEHFGFGTTEDGSDYDRVSFKLAYNIYGYTQMPVHNAGAWEHWVAVYDGTKAGNSERLRIYVDGVKQELSFNGTIPSTTESTDSPVLIGGEDGGGLRYPWNGSLDDVRIYNRTLSASEITNLYNLGK